MGLSSQHSPDGGRDKQNGDVVREFKWVQMDLQPVYFFSLSGMTNLGSYLVPSPYLINFGAALRRLSGKMADRFAILIW